MVDYWPNVGMKWCQIVTKIQMDMMHYLPEFGTRTQVPANLPPNFLESKHRQFGRTIESAYSFAFNYSTRVRAIGTLLQRIASLAAYCTRFVCIYNQQERHTSDHLPLLKWENITVQNCESVNYPVFWCWGAGGRKRGRKLTPAAVVEACES
jgi:hypothetical protein